MDWLGITENAFHYIVDQHRNPQIWERDKDWNWRLRSEILRAFAENGDLRYALRLLGTHTDFIVSDSGISTDQSDRYILIGKGKN